jgi:hypothetical protein
MENDQNLNNNNEWSSTERSGKPLINNETRNPTSDPALPDSIHSISDQSGSTAAANTENKWWQVGEKYHRGVEERECEERTDESFIYSTYKNNIGKPL